MTRRLFPVFLVLLQSGLAVGHVHTHPNLPHHTQTPHVHGDALLDLFGHEQHDEDTCEDTVELSDLLSPAVPPAIGFDTFALELVCVGPVIEATSARPFTLGLPPSTAGPPRPLYITFCALAI